MNELIIFDIDRTLISGQSQKLLLSYSFENNLINLFTYLKIYLWFILYKVGIAKKPKKIMQYAYLFLRGKTKTEVELIIKDFFNTSLRKYIFKEAYAIISEHKSKGRRIVLLSNTIDVLAREMANSLGIKDYIGTELEIHEGKFTGNIIGEIVYGEEKVARLDNFIKNNNLSLRDSWAYGDHISDIHVLKKVDYPFVVNPDNHLRNEAKNNNWPILIFKTFIFN